MEAAKQWRALAGDFVTLARALPEGPKRAEYLEAAGVALGIAAQLAKQNRRNRWRRVLKFLRW